MNLHFYLRWKEWLDSLYVRDCNGFTESNVITNICSEPLRLLNTGNCDVFGAVPASTAKSIFVKLVAESSKLVPIIVT